MANISTKVRTDYLDTFIVLSLTKNGMFDKKMQRDRIRSVRRYCESGDRNRIRRMVSSPLRNRHRGEANSLTKIEVCHGRKGAVALKAGVLQVLTCLYSLELIQPITRRMSMKKPLSKSIKSLYGIGDFGFGLMSGVETFLFVFFLTTVAKFSLPMVALIGTVTSVVDASLSPFYGAIISGMKPLRWGRNRSWLVVGPPLVVVLYMFEFTKIGPDPVAIIIICAGFILSHIVWNIGWVANVALIPVMANGPEERGLLSARRATYTSLATVAFSYVGAPLVALLGRITGHPILGYTLAAGILGLSMLLCYLVVFKITDGYEPIVAEGIQNAAASSRKSENVSGRGMLRSLFQNVYLIVLLVGDFFRYMVNFMMTAAAAFYFAYVAQNMLLFPLYLLLGGIAQVVGSYLSGGMVKAFSARTSTIVSLFGLAASLILGKFVGMNLLVFFVVIMFARLFLGVLTASMVALYGDASVYSQWKTGENATPFIMGMMNLSLKIAIISRGTIIPAALAAVGFSAIANPATASVALKMAVINVFVFIPGIFALVSALVMTFGYRLTREKVVTCQAEIDKGVAQGNVAKN